MWPWSSLKCMWSRILTCTLWWKIIYNLVGERNNEDLMKPSCLCVIYSEENHKVRNLNQGQSPWTNKEFRGLTKAELMIALFTTYVQTCTCSQRLQKLSGKDLAFITKAKTWRLATSRHNSLSLQLKENVVHCHAGKTPQRRTLVHQSSLKTCKLTMKISQQQIH